MFLDTTWHVKPAVVFRGNAFREWQPLDSIRRAPATTLDWPSDSHVISPVKRKELME